MNTATAAVLTNVVLFQIGWWSCVWSAGVHKPWIGVVVVSLVIGAHLCRASMPMKELQLVLLALGIGLVFDSLLVAQGWVAYSSGTVVPNVAPYWIVALWGLFATLLNVSLRWMRRRWITAALLGALGGPAAYIGGLRLGALHFTNLGAGLAALSLGWAVLTPLLLMLAERYDGQSGLSEAVAT
jgi:hypothetical protein